MKMANKKAKEALNSLKMEAANEVRVQFLKNFQLPITTYYLQKPHQ